MYLGCSMGLLNFHGTSIQDNTKKSFLALCIGILPAISLDRTYHTYTYNMLQDNLRILTSL